MFQHAFEVLKYAWLLTLLNLICLFCLGVRVISNAGGINPLACAAALQEVAKKADVDLKIAVVAGDDLMSEVLYFLLRITGIVEIILVFIA